MGKGFVEKLQAHLEIQKRKRQSEAQPNQA
jgi:hypothetical protein